MEYVKTIKLVRVALACLMAVSSIALNSSAISATNLTSGDNVEDAVVDEVPEITDRDVLSGARYDERPNWNDVCNGGGRPDEWWNNKPNYNTNKPNQDPKSENPVVGLKYWDKEKKTYVHELSEQQLIEKLWPKSEEAKRSWRLRDAVITPKDKCYFANQENGYGEEVGERDNYTKHNYKWELDGNAGGERQTPRPVGSNKEGAQAYNPDDISYLGNYYFQNRAGKYWFTIVTRPLLQVDKNGHYYHPETKEKVGQYYIGGNSFPRVYDTVGTRENLLDPSQTMYQFTNVKSGDVIRGNQSPTVAGWYDVLLQTPEDIDEFILPGMWKERVIYMDKGYRSKFQKTIDGGNLQDMNNSDWNHDSLPDPFDATTKNLFDIDLYKQGTSYKIPIPKYDEDKYIFDGWDVYEEKWNKYYDYTSEDRRSLEFNTNENKYMYTPKKVDDNQYFVLNARLVAKFRTRKTNNVNVILQFIDDNSNFASSEKVSINKTSILLKEKIENLDQFIVTVAQGKAYDFIGFSRTSDGNNILSRETQWSPWNIFNPNSQHEIHKNTDVYAILKPKKVKIKFDGNGGSLRPSVTSNVIDSKYYDTITINNDNFYKDGYSLSGWSTSPNGKVEIPNGSKFFVNSKDIDGKFPEVLTLYAVWGKSTAIVNSKKDKDSLLITSDTLDYPAKGILLENGKSINAYELGRFYLDFDFADLSLLEKDIDTGKLFVSIEKSIDGGNSWTKLSMDKKNDWPIITSKFGASNSKLSKALYDTAKQKWFVPILIDASRLLETQLYEGLYRVVVAYDDSKAVDKIASEQEYLNGTNLFGWYKSSDNLEVKVVQSASSFIKVPASVTMVDVSNPSSQGNVGQIESLQKSIKVEVVPFTSTNGGKNGYDWATPNNALVNQSNGSYNSNQHQEFIKQKPFVVTVEWDGTLVDSTNTYSLSNIEMVSNIDGPGMKNGQVITSGTKREFMYDGKNDNKLLFDFYLKGSTTKNLPSGITLIGKMKFKVSPR